MPRWWPGVGASRPWSAPRRFTSTSDSFTIGNIRIGEGDVISIDGTKGHRRGGRGPPVTLGEPPEEFKTILGWADKVRKGKLAVRANADNGPDAANARQFGAEGIGLCRTEHMFLAEDRLPIVRRMILASTEEPRRPPPSRSCGWRRRPTSRRSWRRWTTCR